MKKLKCFTLSETMIVLAVLGIITVLVVPQLVKRQREVQNRSKIKKSMSVYDYLINRIILENDIHSTNALKSWADADCSNSSNYFKVVKTVDNSKCKFKTSDGVYWDITNIDKPIVSVKQSELSEEKAEDKNNKNTFFFLARFDDQGILRVSDNMYESVNGTAEDKRAMNKLYAFLKGVALEDEEPNEDDNIPKIHINGKTMTYCAYVNDHYTCGLISEAVSGDYIVEEVGYPSDWDDEHAKSDEICAAVTYPECKHDGNYHILAKKHCESKGKRLATVAELKSMQEAGTLPCSNPGGSGSGSGNGSCWFWAAEEYAPATGWYVSSDGAVSSHAVNVSYNGQVLCVK